MKLKILLIKLGYSETLDPEIGVVPSLGDVVRTTPILTAVKERWPDSTVTWVTDAASLPLLKGIAAIDRLLAWDPFVPLQLSYEQFDILINLEKIAGVCALADSIRAWQKFGFRFLPYEGTYMVYAGGEEVYRLVTDPSRKRANRAPWQQILIEMIGGVWRGQPYLLGHRPRGAPTRDIGFNHLVGRKFPHKAWPEERWAELERRLAARGLSVSRQMGKDDLVEYIDWIASCRLLVTNDSLGLHLALALGRPVVALFGPTAEREIHFYGQGTALRARRPCRDCRGASCALSPTCMAALSAARVERAALALLPRKDAADATPPVRRPRRSCGRTPGTGRS